MRLNLILYIMKRSMEVVTAVIMMLNDSTKQRDNYEEELDPYILENLLLYDSDDEITEHHTGTGGELAQPINMNQEARKSVRMAKEKAYRSGRLWCDDLLKIDLSGPLDCKVILMTLLPMLRLIRSLEK